MQPRCLRQKNCSRCFLSLFLALFLATVYAMPEVCAKAQTRATIPNTPAGKQLSGYLVAFNSGNRATLQAFLKTNMEAPPNDPAFSARLANEDLQLYGQTHGFTVRQIKASSPAAIRALVQANATSLWTELSIFVTAQPPDYVNAIAPYHIVGIGRRDTKPPPEFLGRQKLTPAQLHIRIDALMKTLVAQDAFSGTVYVAKDGKPLYTKAFGFANKAWQAPNRVDTRFNLASITKMFTAVAVAQLVEQGKLSYEDTVGKILPNYPNSEVAQHVTLRQLLSHTSGMIGARALAEKAPPVPTLRTITEMVQPFAKEALTFPPGQQFDYSNAGFILLGAIIEKASGQTYYRYAREYIFQPAGMTHTDFYALDTDPPNLATGYKDGPNGKRLANLFDLGVIGSPAGGAYSTGEDMDKFHRALVHHKLLRQPSLEALWTGVTEEPNGESEYGYGAEIQFYAGTRIVGHGGGWMGITNRLEMYPDLGYTVVVLSNYDDDPNAIANKLSEWLLQGSPQATPLPPTPPVLALTANVSATSVDKGRSVAITVTVKNTGGTAHAGVVDMEVKDANGAKVNQQFTTGQKIKSGQTRRYTYTWTPNVAGNYTVDVGAFGPGWKPKYRFEAGAAKFVVN